MEETLIASPETGSTRKMTLNMGPQHPSTHGVLRIVLELDGETILTAAPDIGYLHTGIEKEFEVKLYAQGTPLTDRVDYLANLSNNLCYALTVEKLLGLEMPARVKYTRVLMAELTRLNSHLVWLGTHALDIGAMTVFLYAFREREEILKIFENYCGARLTTSYTRIGGLMADAPEGWEKDVKAWVKKIMINESLMWLRRRHNFHLMETLDESTPEPELEQFSLLEAEDIYQFITQLPIGYRAVFNLSVVEGYSHLEIALALSITESTSRTQLFKAKAMLKKMLTQEGFN